VTRRSPLPARAARLIAPAAVAAAVLALTGCQLTSPIQTDVPYVAGDGVSVDLDDVHIRNLVVVAEQEGGPGTVSGAVVNRSAQSATITFAGETGSATAQVPAHGQVQISEATRVTLPSVAAAPGGVVTLQVGSTSSAANIVKVPVLLPDGYYADLKPAAAPTTAPAG
jgi:hypothetical protein